MLLSFDVFHIHLRAYELQNWISISMVRPLDDIQGPWILMVTALCQFVNWSLE